MNEILIKARKSNLHPNVQDRQHEENYDRNNETILIPECVALNKIEGMIETKATSEVVDVGSSTFLASLECQLSRLSSVNEINEALKDSRHLNNLWAFFNREISVVKFEWMAREKQSFLKPGYSTRYGMSSICSEIGTFPVRIELDPYEPGFVRRGVSVFTTSLACELPEDQLAWIGEILGIMIRVESVKT